MQINIDQLRGEYQAGATLRELGQRYAYSHTQIAAFLRSAGVPRRRVGRKRKRP